MRRLILDRNQPSSYRIAKLPRTRQRFVMDVLDSMLGQAGR
jgi:hypothetical protein